MAVWLNSLEGCGGERVKEILAHWIPLLWPDPTQQELLLDLGEHKGWTGADWDAACQSLGHWLHQELGLPETLVTEAPCELNRSDVLGILKVLPTPKDVKESTGVSKINQKLSAWLGVGPKTFANMLSKGLCPDRWDHRWLRLLARLMTRPPDLDALLYHRRSQAAVTAEFQRRGQIQGLDAADMLLLFSLIALYQRRRPTHEVRANRKKPQSRRQTAKPVIKLSGQLLMMGQFKLLMELAANIAPGALLASICIECALTEAHLAPHIGRKGEKGTSGEEWLSIIEKELVTHSQLMGEDTELFLFRIQVMRAYAQHEPMPAPPPALLTHHYVHALQQIDAARHEKPAAKLDPMAGGVFMLLPQARQRGLVL